MASGQGCGVSLDALDALVKQYMAVEGMSEVRLHWPHVPAELAPFTDRWKGHADSSNWSPHVTARAGCP